MKKFFAHLFFVLTFVEMLTIGSEVFSWQMLSAQSMPATPSFSDVSVDSEHYAAIEYLKTKGIISGYPDKTFQPNKTINRAEALKVLLLAANISTTSSSKNLALPFSDVNAKDWFYTYVHKAFSMHFIQGYPDKTFRPTNVVNFAESLKLMVAVFAIDLSNISLDAPPYPDVEVNAWYAKNFAAAKIRNLIFPKDDGKIHPEQEMSRGDFVEIAYRILYLRENKIDRFPLNLNWPKFTHPTDHYSLQFPFDWQAIDAAGQMVFWKQDTQNGQVSFSRVFPNSATVITALDANPNQLSLDQYLAKIQYDSTAEIKKQTINGYPAASVAIAGNGLKDFYFELPNHAILILYCQSGDGTLKNELQNQIDYLASSVRYEENSMTDEKSTQQISQSSSLTNQGENTNTSSTTNVTTTSTPTTTDLLLSKVRAALLQKGKGQEMLALFSDKVIIETDTIGIGTGPVDYYYSAEYGVTLKYERNSDTLLAMKNGKTSAF